MNEQAILLNESIKKNNPSLIKMLSVRGSEIFFPKLGILAQSAQPKAKKLMQQ